MAPVSTCPHGGRRITKVRGEEDQHLHQDIWRHILTNFPHILVLRHSVQRSNRPNSFSLCCQTDPETETRAANEVWLVLRARPGQECREVVWLHSLTCQAQGPPPPPPASLSVCLSVSHHTTTHNPVKIDIKSVESRGSREISIHLKIKIQKEKY